MITGKWNTKSSQESQPALLPSGTHAHRDPKKNDLQKFLPDTKLQGAKLLSEQSLGVNQKIGAFLVPVVKLPFPWAKLK